MALFFKKNIYALSILLALLLLASCTSSPSAKGISRNLADSGIKSSDSLYKFFMAHNPMANKKLVKRLSAYYIKEAGTEGINSDCAWVQMCLETGFLKFGNLVTSDMHNYCGLGAIDEEHRGEVFETELLGVRAHIQHLHAYATTEKYKLKNELVDPRYKWVSPRGKAKDIYSLSGTWAADTEYGSKLDALLESLEQF